MKKIILPAVLLLSLLSCSNNSRNDFRSDIASWRRQRIERLKSPEGWLNLAGLFWLKEGHNSLGSDSSNSILFPSGTAPFLGEFIKNGDSISYVPPSDNKVSLNGIPAAEGTVVSDDRGKPDLFASGSFAWYIIKRDSLYGIRLRDYNHTRIKQLDSIPSYPASEEWRIKARFIPFDSAMNIEVATVIGGREISQCPGKLVFRKGLRKYTLLPFSEGDSFFIIFADRTNGRETYGNGRFLYSALPDSAGEVVLDFNKAYNPPCAFSPFATCPMPPRENLLALEVLAGEKEVHLK